MGVVCPGAVLLEVHPNRVVLLAAGHPDTLARPGLPAPTRTLDRRDCLLIPPLVNAHAHLDLTHIGPIPHDPADGFVAWVDHIRANRRTDPADIAAAVELGVRLSVAGGTAAVGDIAGAPAGRLTDTPARVLAASPMAGVSYLEFFGIGRSAPAGHGPPGAVCTGRTRFTAAVFGERPRPGRIPAARSEHGGPGGLSLGRGDFPAARSAVVHPSCGNSGRARVRRPRHRAAAGDVGTVRAVGRRRAAGGGSGSAPGRAPGTGFVRLPHPVRACQRRDRRGHRGAGQDADAGGLLPAGVGVLRGRAALRAAPVPGHARWRGAGCAWGRIRS
jgi:hypothetical protein